MMPAALAFVGLSQLAAPPPAAAPARDRPLARSAVQFLGGTAAGTVAALPPLFVGLGILLSEDPDADERRGAVLLVLTPLAYAAGDALAVHLIGKGFDGGRAGRFGPTFLGALAGSAAGAAVIALGGWEGAGLWAGGMALGTVGAIVGYNASRPGPVTLSAGPGGIQLTVRF